MKYLINVSIPIKAFTILGPSICGRLWRFKTLPSITQIESIWDEFANEERHRVAFELATLSPNQRAVIAELAKNLTEQPSSKEFLSRVRLSSASNTQALKVLQEKDLIYRDENGLMRSLNPVIEYIIKQ